MVSKGVSFSSRGDDAGTHPPSRAPWVGAVWRVPGSAEAARPAPVAARNRDAGVNRSIGDLGAMGEGRRISMAVSNESLEIGRVTPDSLQEHAVRFDRLRRE